MWENNMNFFKKINHNKIKKLPSLLLAIFVLIIVVVSLIISANKMMQYLAIRQENDLLQCTFLLYSW